MLAGLGLFIFETDSLLFDELSRSREWRHAQTERFGARPASQFLGPGGDTVTLSGTLVPELAGAYSSLDTLAEMADSGDAYPLADGSGTVFGQFTIGKIEERQSNFIVGGRARQIGFTIELTRVD